VGSAFEQAGITAVVFVDAREALAAFSADPTRFDLIVTDLTMPSLSGIEVATAARRQRQVPVLLLTGGGTADEELHASGAIDLVLRKPFSMRELLMLAMQLLQARGQVPPRVQAS
jgi:DNA-binding response OmpR family regulator